MLWPTWRGWLLLTCLASLALWIGIRMIYPFLAVNSPRPGGVLVIQGWIPDYCLEEVTAEFHRNHYEKMYVVGGRLDKGALLLPYKYFPELTAAVLRKAGMRADDMVLVQVEDERQERTYAAAIALKHWWRDHQSYPARINLMSVGPHARRSRLLFEKALGDGASVGVLALAPRDFDPEHWWRSSAGFRSVVGEAIGYGYSRVLFRRPKEDVAP